MLSGSSLPFLSIHLISVLIMLFLAVLALLHDWKNLLNLAFACIMLSTAGWVLANIGTFNLPPQRFEIALDTALLFASIQTLAGAVFIYLFPNRSFILKLWHKVLFILFSLGFIAIAPFAFNIDSEIFYPNTRIPVTQPNIFNALWGIGILLLLTVSIAMALIKYRKSNSEEKKQLRAVLIGNIATFALLFLSQYLTVTVFETPALNSYGPLFMMPLIIGTGYAITKYRLFNIKAITTEIVTFALWLFLLLRVLFDNSLQNYLIDSTLLVGTIIIGIFLIKSVLNEVRQKEKLAELNTKLDKTNADLNDLNNNLEQKVAEQTVEIRRAYEVEKKARIELEELDKAKDQFILTTQHPLRTPLTIVKGYLQSILTQKTTKLDPTTTTYVVKAEESTERISSLVNELLDISQMEVGKSILSKQSVNIGELIIDILRELEMEIKKRDLTVNMDIASDINLSIDKTKIREALFNLVDNSVKYNREKGLVNIGGELVKHPIEKDKWFLKLTIEDQGIGLTPEEAQKAFNQYFERGKEAEELYTTGRGIGLAVTKNIIQAHGGKVYAESAGRGKGSKFIVELPV